jgi:hypothetical protein
MLEGLQKLVYAALREIEGPATAKEIAARIGCRPREAGNAATLLARDGYAGVLPGEGPRRYHPSDSYPEGP